MKMQFNLNLVQSQKLVMTPELKQAIEILQYNTQELNAFLQEELLNNPVLQQGQNQLEEEARDYDKAESESPDREDVFDKIDWREVAQDFEDGAVRHKTPRGETAEDVNYDNFVASEVTLAEHLLEQLHLTGLSSEDQEAVRFLILNLDPNGYLDLDLREFQALYGKSEQETETLLQVVQNFDPMGVGARDLRECLLIQLGIKAEDTAVAERIVSNHLDELARNRIKEIAKAEDVSVDVIQDAVALIRSLEPKPGRQFASLRDVRYITPDVHVKKMDGEYVVVVNDATAPRLHINKFYRELLKNANSSEEDIGYISKKLSSALKLIKSIEQRRNTIFKVVESIVRFQYDFFEQGTMYLKTLNLKDVADEIGVHESTVSRAVNGKYLQCAHGLFEIKYFFQSGVSGSFGEGVSSESIKLLIKNLVADENPKKPLSDQKISDQLKESGIQVSRRTIAKYRDELGIPATSKRKQY